MKDTKKKKIIIGIIIGAVLVCLTGVTLFGALLYLFLYGGPATVSKDIADYPKIFSENGLHTAYICFPEQIPEGTLKTDYYHYYRDTWNYATVETFLKCEYTPEAYQKELGRLQNISKTYGNRKVTLLRDDGKKYKFPAFIAVENSGKTYEYALLSGTNEISYIMTTDFGKNDVHFDAKYLPEGYMSGEEGFSIYNSSENNADAANIYTKDPDPDVEDFHTVILDDEMSMVSVKLKLNSDGEEEICSIIHTSDPDVKNGTVNTQEFHDLDGKIFKDIKADYEQHKAVVTYTDNGEEKTAVFP